jgi:hypothetical protein
MSDFARFNDTDVVALRGSVLNLLFDRLDMLTGMQFSRDFSVKKSSGGISISLNGPPLRRTLNISGSAAAGGIYECKTITGQPAVDPGTDQAIPQTGETLVSAFDCYLENNSEIKIPGSHWLPIGSNIEAEYRGFSTIDYKPVYRVYTGNPPVAIKFTGNDADAQYTGSVLGLPSTAASGSAFTGPGGMTVPGSDNALICNVDESGLTGHRIATPSFGVGVVVGATSTGLQIVYTHGGVGRVDSPQTLPHGTYGSPDMTTWQRQVDGTPVKFDPFWIGFDSSSKNFFMMTRTPFYDARGLLFSVSVEVQTTIGTNPCPTPP